MTDRYYRGIRNSSNDTKYKLQIVSMTLKINENKNNINGIKNDTSGINSFSDKVNTNENDTSSNLEKIDNFTQYILKFKDFEQTYTIEKQIFRFNKNTHFYTILEKEIEYEFTKNSLLFVKNNVL